MHHTGTVTDIVEIGDVFGSPTGEVVEGMVAYGVACIEDHVVDMGVFTHVVAHAEKGSLGIVLRQRLQYPWGHLRDWSVIKSEVDFFSVSVHFPDKTRKKCLDGLWRVY